MKKLLLGLGTITAVAVPTVAVVSCSLGSVFKSKINSVGEAQKDLKIMFGELSKDGKLNSDTDAYTSKTSADDVMSLRDSITREQLKGLTFGDSIENMVFVEGARNFGFSDWTGTHHDFYASLPITIAKGKHAYATVLFKYDKTNGVFMGGRRSMIFNGMVAATNMAQELKHVISAIIITDNELK